MKYKTVHSTVLSVSLHMKIYIQPTLEDIMQKIAGKYNTFHTARAGHHCKVGDNVDDITWLLPCAQLMGHPTKLFLPPAKLLFALHQILSLSNT